MIPHELIHSIAMDGYLKLFKDELGKIQPVSSDRTELERAVTDLVLAAFSKGAEDIERRLHLNESAPKYIEVGGSIQPNPGRQD